MPSTMSFIKQFNLFIKTQNFEINCELIISLPLNLKENLKKELLNLQSMELSIVGTY
jgi:hypothetical protein